VLGIVPVLPRLYLPEEDSVALEENARTAAGTTAPGQNRIKIAVVRLPYIANFTDFTPLELEPAAQVLYARDPADLAAADLVILPGSKDTIADLRFLKARGLDRALSRHLERGGAVGGICGGYQMLGRSVSDPYGVESGGEEPGLGLLPVTTILEREKVTRRVTARLLPGPWGDGSGEWEAYEIHTGRTVREGNLAPLFSICRRGSEPAEDTDGVITPDGRVWGTYLHGSLDAPAVRQRLLTWLGGLALPSVALPSADYRSFREAAYNALADTLRHSLNLPVIRSLIGR